MRTAFHVGPYTVQTVIGRTHKKGPPLGQVTGFRAE